MKSARGQRRGCSNIAGHFILERHGSAGTDINLPAVLVVAVNDMNSVAERERIISCRRAVRKRLEL